jgi:hypothetical protein
MYRIVLLLLVSIGLVACNNNDKVVSAWEVNDVYQATMVSSSAVAGQKTYVGPPINTMDANNTYEMFNLRSTQSQTGVKTYELVVMLTYYSQWRYYDSAVLGTSPATSFKVISREAGVCEDRGCIFKELLSIELSDAFLKDRVKKGFQLTVSSKTGVNTDIFVPSQYIKGYLKAVDGTNY